MVGHHITFSISSLESRGEKKEKKTVFVISFQKILKPNLELTRLIPTTLVSFFIIKKSTKKKKKKPNTKGTQFPLKILPLQILNIRCNPPNFKNSKRTIEKGGEGGRKMRLAAVGR